MLKSHQDSKFFQGRKTQQLYKLQLQNVAPKEKKKTLWKEAEVDYNMNHHLSLDQAQS